MMSVAKDFTLGAPIDGRPAPSARGLFRATGNTGSNDAREENDFYPTPAEPTRAFLRAEAERLRDFPTIWEPAAGDGAMVREIEEAGHRVHASDLIDRGCGAEIRSFYDYATPPAPAAITNPPYQEINWRDGRARWLRYGWEELRLDYMACLLSWSWPGAGGHGSHWAQYPPARVYLMRWKIDFTGGGAPPMLNAWFVWDRAAEGETVLRMLDRKQGAPEALTDALDLPQPVVPAPIPRSRTVPAARPAELKAFLDFAYPLANHGAMTADEIVDAWEHGIPAGSAA